MIYTIDRKYSIFSYFNGTPLDGGYIYIGEENRNPIIYPVSVYADKNYLNEITQPITITNGKPVYAGLPTILYSSENPFSILVTDGFGKKIHYNPSFNGSLFPAVNNKNILIDGDFQLFGSYYQNNPSRIGPDNIQGWIADGSGVPTYQYSLQNFEIDQTDVPGAKRYLLFSASIGAVVDTAADYMRLVQTVEDIYGYSGQYLTLSFYAKANTIEFFKNISTSFTIQYTTGDIVSAIGVKKHTLSLDWIKYSYTFKMPIVSSSLGITPYPDNVETALILNIWIAAGTDYAGETDFLGHIPANSIYTLNIADIKVELSEFATDFERKDIQSEYNSYFRKSETTLEREGIPLLGNQPGYITYVSPGIQSFIPGFKFRQRKRTNSPTVRIYSYATKDEGKVTLVGTGDINVSSVDDIGFDGCGSITLASNTAAGNVYKYHYIVEDEFTL